MAFMAGWGLGGTTPPRWMNGGQQQPQMPQQPQQPMAGGFNPASQQPLTSGPQGMPQSGYGSQNPYHTDNYPVMAPPTAPNQQQMNDFLAPTFSNPYLNSINNAQNQANWFGAATPQAAAFQQQLYGNGMTDMEQTYAGASAQLGSRQLGQTQNRLANMFENSTSHGNLAPAFLDATNQYNQQMNQMIGQMGTQRQQSAAQLLPFTAGFPIQAGQAGQQGAQGLYDMAQNAMYGDLQFPHAMFGSNPIFPPTIIAS